jgi:hypothetical protein
VLPQTKVAVRAILSADQSVTDKERSKIIERIFRADDGDDEGRPAEQDRIVLRGEASKILSRSTRGIDLLARQGLLKKIKLPGRQRCAGFRLSAINKFLESASQ